MIIDEGQARHISAFKSVDLKNMDLETRVEFAKAQGFKEPGVSVNELLTIQKGLDYLGAKPITILETGMCFGTTTRFFLSWVLKHGGEHNSVEFKIREQFKAEMENLGLWPHPQFNPIEKDTRTMNWPETKHIDFLYIDSEHATSDALGEYMRFRFFLNSASIVGFHDTDNCWGVKRALEMIMEIDEIEPIAISSGMCGAGLQVFKIVRFNRNEPKCHFKMNEKGILVRTDL